MGATLSGTGNTKPLIEDKVPCRDTYHFEGNWVRETPESGAQGTLLWTGNQTPLMVDRAPSLEHEKVYDRDARDAIPLSDLH